MTANPYEWNRINPDLFYGRDELLARIGRRLLGGESFGLAGGKRMGKTTFLRRLQWAFQRGAFGSDQAGLEVIPVYVEIHALPSPLSPDVIFDAILACIAMVLPASAASKGEPLHPFARDLARKIAASPKRPQVIVLFDEIQPLVDTDWGPGFLANWRSFLHNEPTVDRYLSAAFAGSQDLDVLRHDMGSPLANILTWQRLELFSREATALLMREPSGLGAVLTDDVVDEMQVATGGHPFLIQYLMHKIFDRKSEPPRDVLLEAEACFLRDQADKLAAWWDGFNETTRRIYSVVVESPEGLARDAIAGLVGNREADRAIDMLCHTGVAVSGGPSGPLRAAGRIFQTWFRNYGRTDLAPHATQHVDELLYRLERRLREVLAQRLAVAHGSNWMTALQKRWPDLVSSWETKAKKSLLNDATALEFSDFGDLFDMIMGDWGSFSELFAGLSRDRSKRKTLLSEAKTVLVGVRNDIRHGRASRIEELRLKKAEVLVLELLNVVSV